jgi:hypothetical protein
MADRTPDQIGDEPVTDLSTILRRLEPVVRPGEFVVVDAGGVDPWELGASAIVVEDEGPTAVLERVRADEAGLPYDFVAAWITLGVPSSLHAVGLTAAFSTALADAGISCNVLAGLRHDHLLVPVDQRDRTLEVLRRLAAA